MVDEGVDPDYSKTGQKSHPVPSTETLRLRLMEIDCIHL